MFFFSLVVKVFCSSVDGIVLITILTLYHSPHHCMCGYDDHAGLQIPMQMLSIIQTTVNWKWWWQVLNRIDYRKPVT